MSHDCIFWVGVRGGGRRGRLAAAFASSAHAVVGQIFWSIAQTNHSLSLLCRRHIARYADAYRNEMVAFVECAHEGKATPVGVEDGRAAYLIGKAAKQSMETGLVSDRSGGGWGGVRQARCTHPILVGQSRRQDIVGQLVSRGIFCEKLARVETARSQPGVACSIRSNRG